VLFKSPRCSSLCLSIQIPKDVYCSVDRCTCLNYHLHKTLRRIAMPTESIPKKKKSEPSKCLSVNCLTIIMTYMPTLSINSVSHISAFPRMQKKLPYKLLVFKSFFQYACVAAPQETSSMSSLGKYSSVSFPALNATSLCTPVVALCASKWGQKNTAARSAGSDSISAVQSHTEASPSPAVSFEM